MDKSLCDTIMTKLLYVAVADAENDSEIHVEHKVFGDNDNMSDVLDDVMDMAHKGFHILNQVPGEETERTEWSSDGWLKNIYDQVSKLDISLSEQLTEIGELAIEDCLFVTARLVDIDNIPGILAVYGHFAPVG